MYHRYLIILSLVLAIGCASMTAPRSSPYLDAARQSAEWLRSVEANGAWPDDALAPEDKPRSDISTGVAGKVLFFLMLHQADPSSGAISDARRGADYLLANLPASLQSDQFPPETSLYYGVAGVGYTLHRAYVATGDQRYLQGARETVRLLAEAARSTGQGVEWSAFNDVLFGSAGSGLYLLYAAREWKDEVAEDLAARAASRLVEEGISDREGKKWFLRDGTRNELPNFSHGTAGIAYFLASTGNREHLQAALSGGRYLDAIATRPDGSYLVPYGFSNPQWSGFHEIGWAHGPAGTARLFERLAQITKDLSWRSKVMASTRVLEVSGAPGAPRPGFGTETFKNDMRFGIASLAEFLIAVGEVERARPLVDFVLAAGVRDQRGLRWPVKRYTFMSKPGTDAQFTGYHYGAAGYGILALRMHNALVGRRSVIRLPDDPFP